MNTSLTLHIWWKALNTCWKRAEGGVNLSVVDLFQDVQRRRIVNHTDYDVLESNSMKYLLKAPGNMIKSGAHAHVFCSTSSSVHGRGVLLWKTLQKDSICMESEQSEHEWVKLKSVDLRPSYEIENFTLLDVRDAAENQQRSVVRRARHTFAVEMVFL